MVPAGGDPAAVDPEALLTLNRLAIVARTVTGTVHEVNNALQIIGGSADLLAQGPGDPDAARRAAQRIRVQTDRAAEALRMLIDLARAGFGGETVESRVSLRQLVTSALTLRSHPLRRAGLTVAFDPAHTPDAMVRGHRGHLLQTTLNLLMNAEQAMAGRSGTIAVTIDESPGLVTLSVIDSGPGIPSDLVPRLFTPFATSHPVPEAQGLGLAAARLIARRHGGDVTLESEAEGARATLRLPVS